MPPKNPWRTLDSRVVYTNPWMTVREDRVVRPDGAEGIYGVIETCAATGVVALTDDDRVYLVGQWRYAFDAYSWEIPEGGAEAGEAPIDAARRELREEAGVVAEHIEPLGAPFHLSNSLSSETGYLFLARGLSSTTTDPDPTEQLAVKTVPFEEALSMVDDGAITDAVTVIALLRAARMRTG